MSEANGGSPHERTVGPVAWYVQRVAPGYRDDGTRLGPFWNREEAEAWADDDYHVIRALHDAAELDRLRALLAEAERLCMEHCPSEMSEALRGDWQQHQTPNAEVSGGRSPSA